MELESTVMVEIETRLSNFVSFYMRTSAVKEMFIRIDSENDGTV